MAAEKQQPENAATERVAEDLPRNRRGPQRESVLIVDDEPAFRSLLARVVQEPSCRVLTAEDGVEAFEIVRKGGVSLVLSDIQMPRMDGIELLKSVKEHDPDIEVVMVSGLAETHVAIEAVRKGASDYIIKPFKVDDVRFAVRRSLEKRRLVLENRAYSRHLERMVEARTRDVVAKSEQVERLLLALEESYEGTLEALVSALDLRDHETLGHSRRVVEYTMLLAESTGVVDSDLRNMRWGAILHDVGKIAVPDSILRKPGKLSPQEMEEMRHHPQAGFNMLQHIPFLRAALEIVLCHHERWDGAGYPHGLQGREIPRSSRIFSLVDSFDAMTSDRSYRKALTLTAARREITENAGHQFDPEAVRSFLQIPEKVWEQTRLRAHAVGGGTRPG